MKKSDARSSPDSPGGARPPTEADNEHRREFVETIQRRARELKSRADDERRARDTCSPADPDRLTPR